MKMKVVCVCMMLSLVIAMVSCPFPGPGPDDDGDPDATYEVTYEANGADGGTPPSDQIKLHGVDLTLAGNTGSLTRTGFTYAGWNTKADGSGTHYAEGATYSTNAGVTLHANWTTLPTYTVTYDGNGADCGTPPVSQTKIQGSALTVAGNTGSLGRTG